MGICITCEKEAADCRCGVAAQKKIVAARRSGPILGNQHHEAVDPHIDQERLLTQYDAIIKVLSDHEWHTQYEIADITGAPQGSVGSQIRNARVAGLDIPKRRVSPERGTWEYRWVGSRAIGSRPTDEPECSEPGEGGLF